MENEHSICPKCNSETLQVRKLRKKAFAASLFLQLAWIGLLLVVIGLVFAIIVPDDQPLTRLSNDMLGLIFVVIGLLVAVPAVLYRNHTTILKKYQCMNCGYNWERKMNASN